jgi:large subunit ribosomal protein L15
MKLENMSGGAGSRTSSKRLGRGIGSGKGKTSGKGHKGQWARSGGGVRIGFEGGTMPLIRRLPKRGFTNHFKKVYSIVNLSSLELFASGETINAENLLAAGVLSKIESAGLKILGGGELTKKLTVVADKISASAKQAIEKAGGTVELIPPQQPWKRADKKTAKTTE